MNDPGSRNSFTGRSWGRKPRRRVLWVDDLARRLITLSGIGSIVAVSLVGLFLVWVVLPLLAPPRLEFLGPGPRGAAGRAPLVAEEIDPYSSLAWTLDATGRAAVHELAGAAEQPAAPFLEGQEPTAWAFSGDVGRCLFAFADGTIRTGTIGLQVDYLDPAAAPPGLADLPADSLRAAAGGLIARTPEGQLRRQRLELDIAAPVAVSERAILHADLALTPSGIALALVDEAGVFHDRRITWKTNLLTGERTARTRGGDLDLAAEGLIPAAGFARVLMDDTGNLVLLVGRDGMTAVLGRGPDGAFAVETVQDLLPADELRVTGLQFLAGRISLAVGDSGGGLTVWFPVRGGEDRAARLEPVHRLRPHTAAVTALTAATRSRLLAAGYADGSVRVFHATTERLLGEGRRGEDPVTRLVLSPRGDLLLAGTPAGVDRWRLQAPYPEVDGAALLRPVWYEGYPGPAYVWQSSAASDSFEPKLSLVPLIHGTLKATFYSLLFGLPLALLAAIYTSEFLPKQTRARVKPVIEVMASLPSVVLGFLAALVLAPVVERIAVEVLSALLTVPFAVLGGAHLWQLLPRQRQARWAQRRPAGILLMILAGVLLAGVVGPHLEAGLFHGDFKAWLDGRVGTGLPGWFFLLLGPCALLAGWANVRHGEGLLRGRGPGWTPWRLGLLDLTRFLVSSALVVALAFFLAWLLDASGWDPRGTVFGTYVQRNALVVGIAMGFAVIPIIYSISEDALTAVPDTLRAASLGAGATPWQTAVRVVVPPAMSGLFSAAMIGLGRAVGETMIVLMAAGNTPIMDLNLFNGFRTLSANLAVELPEAVQGSTHYRTLFLAALTLFAMTFVLNTVAEVIRLHFRGKANRL